MEIDRRSFLKLSAASIAGAAVLVSPTPALASSGNESQANTNGKGMLVDTTKCVGCRACVVACKQWNHNPSSPVDDEPKTHNDTPLLDSKTFTNIRATDVQQGLEPKWVYTKIQCMHCQKPGCAEACLVGALKKTETGPVTYNESKCIGCRYCMVACPFGIPTYQWESVTPWIRKCTFCANRQAQGLQPACSGTCPTGALKFANRSELIDEAKQRIADEPQLYINHIYGETEVGGTSWLYLASVPFEKLGLPNVQTEPVVVNAERAMGLVPPVLLGMAALMTGTYLVTKRRKKLQAKTSKKDEQGAKTK